MTTSIDNKLAHAAIAVAIEEGDPRRAAMLIHLIDGIGATEIDPDDVTEPTWGHGSYGNGQTFAYGKEEYNVCNDGEADSAWNESLDSYIDDCILPEMPEELQSYFDEDKWKSDARMDGRGHCLSSYDGDEHEISVDGEWFYIYRTN